MAHGRDKTKWKPGQSGNPGGRPKEEREVLELARQHSPEAIRKLVEWMRSDSSKASIMACQALLDRAFGKPAQAVAVSGSLTHSYDQALLALLNGALSDQQQEADGSTGTHDGPSAEPLTH
jgi:hypothetical protein